MIFFFNDSLSVFVCKRKYFCVIVDVIKTSVKHKIRFYMRNRSYMLYTYHVYFAAKEYLKGEGKDEELLRLLIFIILK